MNTEDLITSIFTHGGADEEMKRLLTMVFNDDEAGLEEYWESQPIDGTSTILVQDIKKKYPEWSTNKKVLKIIEKAEELKYDDMHDEDGMGKMNLVIDLEEIGALDLAQKVKDGDYDIKEQ